MNHQDGSMASYATWLSAVSTHQFADELVLAATADLLKVCIVTVPSVAGWLVSQHPDESLHEGLGLSIDHQFVLGNNDVHYVWLCHEPLA
jgi:hypothetical protein